MLVVKQHSAEVTSAVWLPDGERIITGSHDKNMHMHSVTGELLRTWRGHRINDLALTADGRHLLATPSGEACVRVYQLDGERETALLSVQSIISICLAADSRDLLVHLANGRINLVELPEEMSGNVSEEPIRTYDGPHPSQRTGHWVIRSCFGGCNQSFVLSGSEECKVYVWHRGSGELLAQLEGHTGTVNAVAWNPVNHRMFVSASDDRSIHVWGPK
jgi:WD40 repeat protein